ncbi:MAG TPA: NAD(P)/FAD-dependent oxidoreductase [Aggregatilineales bacterium]|nr:NAD(P)/FAD-dependent oxidoreductase [Aggregatilineales bacterium]
MAHTHNVVVVGGGFGGLYAAKKLAHLPVQLTLLDRRNFHLFQPLLYQVATGALSPANIAAPLRGILRRQANVEVWLADVTGINVERRVVKFVDGEIHYDTLIVATGVSHAYFGHDEWERFAPGLKTVEDATKIRGRVLAAFEAAERESDPKVIEEWLTFVIAGGGPTGVELAGALAEISHHTLSGNFHRIDPARARILLVEGTDRILPTYPPDLSAQAAKSLRNMGVTVMTGSMVTGVGADCVVVQQNAKSSEIFTHTILWAAGVKASPLGQILHDSTGAELDRAGRVIVQPDLTLPGHPEIFVIGDLANYSHLTGKPLPGIAQVAMQQGSYVASVIAARLKGKPLPTFHYIDKGNMATIGRASAVADLGRIKLKGYLGWWAWLFIHLIYLIEFENRALVLLQWAWNYWTRNRSARLITESNALTSRENHAER